MSIWAYAVSDSKSRTVVNNNNNNNNNTGDDREVAFIFQRLSVLIQRFNSALFSETFALHDDPDL